MDNIMIDCFDKKFSDFLHFSSDYYGYKIPRLFNNEKFDKLVLTKILNGNLDDVEYILQQ